MTYLFFKIIVFSLFLSFPFKKNAFSSPSPKRAHTENKIYHLFSTIKEALNEENYPFASFLALELLNNYKNELRYYEYHVIALALFCDQKYAVAENILHYLLHYFPDQFTALDVKKGHRCCIQLKNHHQEKQYNEKASRIYSNQKNKENTHKVTLSALLEGTVTLPEKKPAPSFLETPLKNALIDNDRLILFKNFHAAFEKKTLFKP